MADKSNGLTPRYRFAPLVEAGAKRVRLTPDPIESYDNREGYQADFIGPEDAVPLPTLGTSAKRDVVTFTWKGAKTHVLDYTHFSTAVSKSRRMPIFSACNIDGSKAKTIDRGDVWKFDPRIPIEHQILQEVYGNQKGLSEFLCVRLVEPSLNS